MRARGINYDTGMTPGGLQSRVTFEADVVRQEMQVIARDLNCTAVRVAGGDPERLAVAAEYAAASGLEVWLAPVACELGPAEVTELVADCAGRAEALRRSGAAVVLVAGCELSLFGAGYLPGSTVFERIAGLGKPTPALRAAFAALPARLNDGLASAAAAARGQFGGPITYAAGPWETVDWAPFDIVSVDAYREKETAASFPAEVRRHRRPGKPLAVTEFGCACFAGAGDRGGTGWAIVDLAAEPPRLDGDYIRDEGEQVRYLADLLAVFEQEGVDAAFWFTFAGYEFPRSADPRYDMDLASYGVVSMTGAAQPGHAGLGWEPREVFGAMAAAYGAGQARHNSSHAGQHHHRPAAGP